MHPSSGGGPAYRQGKNGRGLRGCPTPEYRPKLRIAPAHPPHLPKKHGIVGFCHVKAFPDGRGGEQGDREDGQASF
jgi:hypothetical protein